jgi:hypothetical protein
MAAQPPAPDATQAQRAEDMDEVVVTGRRLRELRAAAIEAEDRFYALYNDLNKVDDFDIECSADAPTGSRLDRRSCVTNVQLEARQDHGSQYVQMMQARAAGATATQPHTHPEQALQMRQQEYLENALYLLKVHPELLRLMRERDLAVKRYEVELRKRFRRRAVSD